MSDLQTNINNSNNNNEAIPLSSPISNALLTLQNRNAFNNSNNNAPMHNPTLNGAIPSNLFTNPSIQPSSVINLTNSSDVVIGPMTQYQGPVTIYQYMDATVEARATHAQGSINQSKTTQNSSIVQSAILEHKTLLLVILLIVAIVAVGVTTYLLLSYKQEISSSKKEILFGNNYETGTFPNLGNGHLVVDREQWGAQDKVAKSGVLEHPIKYVLITHVGVQSSPCYNIYKCSIKMRTLQDSAIAEKNLPDIGSNFYVGNDGNIYVGRGWDIVNTYANKSLAVTFMGDYLRHEANEKQFEAVQYLLAYGVTNKYIALDYKLVSQNQTKPTRSPGAYVYKEIVKWPHWYACGMDDNPKCGSEIGLPEVWDARQ